MKRRRCVANATPPAGRKAVGHRKMKHLLYEIDTLVYGGRFLPVVGGKAPRTPTVLLRLYYICPYCSTR